jgi:PTH1 family peptidyl-tRNA hydrolase
MEEKPTIKVIIGLGNPGSKYYTTRHSIGFCILDALVEKHNLVWQKSDLMEYAELRNDAVIYFIKPMTYMNSSGKVIPWLQKKGIKSEDIMVIHDDLEKKFGSISIKQGGSARGHNGLRSIIGMIGQNFWRLRFGIGRPENKEDVGDYVLESFSKDEEPQILELINKACSDLYSIIK